MWRHIASNFLTVAILALAAVASAVAWARHEYDGPGPLAEAICLRVEPGSNFRKVADELAGQGAISSGYIFRVGADYSGVGDRLKAGSFRVSPGASMRDIVGEVTGDGKSTCGTEVELRIGVTSNEVIVSETEPSTGEFKEVAKFDPSSGRVPPEYAASIDDPGVRFLVTLVPGATVWQAVEGLRQAGFLSGEVAALPDEGMLAPDSYDVAEGGARTEILARMAERQGAILAELWGARAPGLPYASPQEALVMASVIEKETSLPAERGKVASVFLNRLAEGMKLQTDPTVIYGASGGRGVLGRALRQSDLRKRTDWNTYVIDGLPPTPIANPGRDSIAAALNPEATEFLFFVADGTGGHAFAVTLADHNDNVARWREIEAERGAAESGGAQDEGE